MTSRIIQRTLISKVHLIQKKKSLKSSAWIQSSSLHSLMSHNYATNNAASRVNSILTNLIRSSGLQQCRMGHTVRVILIQDLEEGEGKGYKGDILNVKAGYARNFLLPKKKAVYATPNKFQLLGLVDPLESTEVKKKRGIIEEPEEDMEEMNEDTKQADILRRYLKNKIVKIRRNVGSNGKLHPGMVDSKALREKLSKQLKIDLDADEHVQIHPYPVLSLLELEDEDTMENFLTQTMKDIDTEKDDDLQLKQVGDYVAKIVLNGGHLVPLKFTVMKR